MKGLVFTFQNVFTRQRRDGFLASEIVDDAVDMLEQELFTHAEIEQMVDDFLTNLVFIGWLKTGIDEKTGLTTYTRVDKDDDPIGLKLTSSEVAELEEERVKLSEEYMYARTILCEVERFVLNRDNPVFLRTTEYFSNFIRRKLMGRLKAIEYILSSNAE
ncbi:hypothetical protein ORI98_02325 [Shewanella sp. ULN5]|uniref:hypothetical protein n=1 Tax=Shewanella sp. ULN5 TaxID=2994678 RepID=UPI00273D4F39|nr:hypothetical protein [Shewanella sp. ULN5]MDP5145276.1 hypothetical protein [Shewanella sp. ULN5]